MALHHPERHRHRIPSGRNTLWLAGQPAFLVRISETERKDGLPERTILPNRRHKDNLLTEQVLIEFSEDLRSAQAIGRGAMSGNVRMCSNTPWLHGHRRPELTSPKSKWQLLTQDSTIAWPAPKQVHRFTRALPAISMLNHGTNGTTTIDLRDLLYLNAFGEDPRKGRPMALLPYPFT